mgnify:CR=1 FL=1
MLSFVGILLFIRFVVRKNYVLSIPKSSVFKVITYFWLLCIIHLIVSLFLKTNWYFYLRNTVIFYASFTFLIGFYWYNSFKEFLHKARHILLLVVVALFPTGTKYYLDRFSLSVFFPLLLKKDNSFIPLILLLLNFIYAVVFASMTVAILGSILFVLITIRHYAYLRLLFSTSLVVFIAFFIYLAPSLQLYKIGDRSYKLFGNVERVYTDNDLLRIDENSSWRTILWYRITVEKFPKNLAGIGFGTPLIVYTKGRNTAVSNYDDEHDAHVTGVHNTYLTLFGRLGIGYLLIIYTIYTIVFKEFYAYKKYYIAEGGYLFFLSFFSISIIGLFNLVLESPIYASLYWVFLGLVARAIYNRPLNENTLTSSQVSS